MFNETINWESAMNQIGDDKDFLLEVLDDLISEATEAFLMMKQLLEDCKIEEVMKTAHRVKGSASYLFAENLRRVSLSIQERTRDTTFEHPVSEKSMNEIKILLDEFETSLTKLKEEIDRRKKEN